MVITKASAVGETVAITQFVTPSTELSQLPASFQFPTTTLLLKCASPELDADKLHIVKATQILFCAAGQLPISTAKEVLLRANSALLQNKNKKATRQNCKNKLLKFLEERMFFFIFVNLSNDKRAKRR